MQARRSAGRRRTGAVWVVAALLLSLSAPTTAITGSLQAEAITMDGPTHHQGDADLLWLQQSGDRVAPISVSFEAARMEAVQYNRTYYYGPTAAGFGASAPVPVEEDPVERIDEQVHATLLDQDPTYRVAIHGMAVGDPFAVAWNTTTSELQPVPGISQGVSGMAGDDPSEDQRGDPDTPNFVSSNLVGPFAFMAAQSGSLAAVATGDLMIELKGIAFQLEGASGTHTLYSTRTATPLEPGVPAAAAHQEDDAFLRIYLHDAVVRFSTSNLHGEAQLASGGGDMEIHGATTFHGATGVVEDAAGDRRLQGDAYEVRRPLAFVVEPARSELSVLQLREPEADRPTGTMVDPTRVLAPTAWFWILGGLAVASMASFGVLLARRSASLPRLDQVEAALEAGRHRRAERLARRILDRDPGQEGAAIALGIACLKGGRPRDAIAAIEQRLDQEEPTDGVLHYVLGLAHYAVDQDTSARQALREAVRRTPALAAEVRAYMDRSGKGAGSAIAMPQEMPGVHGYS